MFPGWLLSAVLFGQMAVSGPAPDPALSEELSASEVAGRGEAEFREGVRLRQAADRARPHFRRAAHYFEELRQGGSNNALLYRDLGNAYLLAGDLPRAILSYHRGLSLAPGDRALWKCLNQARARVAHPARSTPIQPPDAAPLPWQPRWGLRWVFLLTAGLYGLAWPCLTRWRMTRRGAWLAAGLGALLAAALGAGVLGLFLRTRGEKDRPLVVLNEDHVVLRKGNGPEYPVALDLPLNRGVEARLLFERGGWLKIELPGGVVGWVPELTALVDRPDGNRAPRHPGWLLSLPGISFHLVQPRCTLFCIGSRNGRHLDGGEGFSTPGEKSCQK